MEQSTINLLSNYMPMVQRYKSQFLSFNTLLGKTTLTGKISSLDIAENLFEYMESTQEKFGELQEKLINTIMEQSFLNRYEEAYTSISIISDLVGKFVQKRCDNIAMFAKSDFTLKQCLAYNENKATNPELTQQALENLKNYLDKFRNAYGYYKDIIVYEPDGTLMQSLNNEAVLATKIQPILEAASIDNFADFYQKIDFYGEEKEEIEFFFVVPIRIPKDPQIKAVMVFIIELEQEISKINTLFPYRLPQSNLIIVDSKQRILFSDDLKHFAKGQILSPIVHQDHSFLEIRSRICMLAQKTIGNAYGYNGIARDWLVYRCVPLHIAFDVKKQTENKIDPILLEDSLLITEELDSVIAEAENINEDLGDVVINGEIIASKSHSYALNPILNNIRNLSDEMNALCFQSTEELQKGIYDALFNVISYYPKCSITMVDSFFEESFKDVKWIRNCAEFSLFANEIQKEGIVSEATLESVKALLKRLGSIHSIYHNIILFDKEGKVVLDSASNTAIYGKKVAVFDKIQRLKNNLLVSNYEHTLLFDDKPAYVFYTALFSDERVSGGLAFIFNLSITKEILMQTLPKDSAILSDTSEIISVICDNAGNIYASTQEDFSFEKFNISEGEPIDFKNFKPFKKIIKIENKYYLVCCDIASSHKGTITDYTKNPLFCLVFVAVKEDNPDDMF
ncbi:MAG: cache domain-containing protein [Helicobacter sp.]|nr:cache domain-containing protein [Helicobacter sp.]